MRWHCKVDARARRRSTTLRLRRSNEFGRLDILLANHGVVDFSTGENTTDEAWDTTSDRT